MKTIKYFFVLLSLNFIVQAQEKSYYAWVDVYEGYSKGFCIKFDGQHLIDTFYVLDVFTQPIPDPSPKDYAGWKDLFRKFDPIKMKMEYSLISGDSIKFSTAKHYYDEERWFSFSFSGLIFKGSIRGEMLEQNANGAGGIINEDKFNIKFKK
jgi:hypothetical protein